MMLTIRNPANGKILKKIKSDTASSITKKLGQALMVQEKWKRVPLDRRKEIISAFSDSIQKNVDPLAKLLTSEMGKPIRQSRNEIVALQSRIDYFLYQVSVAVAPEDVASSENAVRERITYEPLGVVANISAWNYPYFVGSNVFVPALLTGNAILYKPSEYSTLTGLAIAEHLKKSGLPAGLFQTIIGGGAVGKMLTQQSVDGLFFTGSYATGRLIAREMAERMIHLQLELGGKDPLYVCDDVDPAKAAASAAEGAFYNAGQSCCAVERIYVHASLEKSFLNHFVEAVKSYRVGDPLDSETFIGPLARREQLSVLEKQVRDAVRKGAKLLLGGKRIRGKGNFFEPTVLSHVNHQMAVMREESFGPIIGIQRVKDDAEAVAKMNDTPYGLTAAVYSNDSVRAERILELCDTGTVYENCCDRVSPRLPWSGRKHSGIGSTLSVAGIRTFVRPKAWHMRPASS